MATRRTAEHHRQHYEIEKELAHKLRTASKEDRRILYRSSYDELFRRVPDHPQLVNKISPVARAAQVERQIRRLQQFLTSESAFLEIGPGDCQFSFAVSPLVRTVFAVDVSEEIVRVLERPANFTLILSDGCSIPVPDGSVTVAFSDQLMEHLHPDDAEEQLRNIYKALAPGGNYICITPNRLSGPHDISVFFDDVATGFHLHEYTAVELVRLLRSVGFRKVVVVIWTNGHRITLPFFLVKPFEGTLARLPGRWGKRLRRSGIIRRILGIRVVATK